MDTLSRPLFKMWRNIVENIEKTYLVVMLVVEWAESATESANI